MSSTARISNENHLIPVIEPKDYGSAGIDGVSVNVGLVNNICFDISFGLLTGNSILSFYCGATTGAKTTAIAFEYRLGAGVYKAALSDTAGAIIAVASTGLTLVAATFIHKQITVEFDSADMLAGKPWLTISIDATATVLAVSCAGICYARTVGHIQPSTI